MGLVLRVSAREPILFDDPRPGAAPGAQLVGTFKSMELEGSTLKVNFEFPPEENLRYSRCKSEDSVPDFILPDPVADQ